MSIDVWLGWLVTLSLSGSLLLAVVDKEQRQRYMDIASTSVGAFWGLQRPVKHKGQEKGSENNECERTED